MLFWAGLAIFAHACYSYREFIHAAELVSKLSTPSVPRNIIVELLLGFVLTVVSLVRNARSHLQPINVADQFASLNNEGLNPFQLLESRPGFQDIAARRQHYMDMLNKKSDGSKKNPST